MSYKHLKTIEVRVADDGSGIGLLLRTKSGNGRYHLPIEELPRLVRQLLSACYEPELAGHLPRGMHVGLPVDLCDATFIPALGKVALAVVLKEGFAIGFAVPVHEGQRLARAIEAVTQMRVVDDDNGKQ